MDKGIKPTASEFSVNKSVKRLSKVEENQRGLELDGKYQLLAYADLNCLSRNMNSTNKAYTRHQTVIGRSVCKQIHRKLRSHLSMARHRNAGWP
jgi:hypothetical protein